MPELTAELLPLPQRLALSYAPARSREAVLTLMLLDERLASILRNRSEVIIAQMKLAWWRDRLGDDPRAWPEGEPLLDRLKEWPAAPSTLVPLVDGWERLLADDPPGSALAEFAEGRARGWSTLAAALGSGTDDSSVLKAGSDWALADLALHLDNPDEARSARELALAGKGANRSLPRIVRPLAVLHGLALRALVRDSNELLDGPLAMLVALRIGITGR